MYDIRLRQFTPTGVKGKVLKTRAITFTSTRNGTPLLTFSMDNSYAGTMEAPFLVGVEVSRDGSSWVTPRNNLMIALEDDADSSTTDVVSFTADGFVGWSLAAAIHWWAVGATADPWKRKYVGSPGQVLRALIAEVQARGTMPNVTMDFSNAADSVGQAWTNDDKIDMQLELWRPLATFVRNWSEQGHFDWWAEGTTFRVARSGYGADRTTSVMFGGRGFTSSPVRSDFRKVVTRMVLIPDGTTATHMENLTSDLQFGHIESSMSQSGIDTHDKAKKQAQSIMNDLRTKGTELEYNWTPTGKMVAPFLDFNVGDEVTARRRSGKSAQRVISVQVVKDVGGKVEVRAVVGTELIGLTARIAKKANASSQGQIISGSGSSLPPSAGVASGVPLAPTGVVVTSNVARWRRDGTAVADIRVEWQAVVTATDESAITVSGYEIATRAASGVPSVAARTDGTEWTRELLSGQLTLIQVRALSMRGEPGEWSDEIAVTPAMPASIIPAGVTGLHVVSNVGAFRADGSAVAHVVLGWGAVTLSDEGEPLEVDRYEIRLKRGDEDAPFATSAEAGVAFTLAAGENVEAIVHARSVKGVWGDYSLPLQIVGATPAQDASPPSAPLLTSSLGMVFIAWDGLLESGTPAAGFQHVIVEVAVDDEDFMRQGPPLVAQGSGQARAPMGSVVSVRFFPVDTLGRVGSVSNVAQITVVGVTGDDVVYNTILANHIGVSQVTLAHLAADVGQSLDISSNESINLLITAQSETQGALDTLSTWFRVDVYGAHIGQVGNPFQAHMMPGKFSITENGQEVSFWEGGRMVVPSLVTEEVVLSNHKFEKYGDGTVIRALG